MIRNAAYTNYKGKEYRIGQERKNRDNGIYFLVSHDVSDLQNGFTEYDENIYTLDISKSELNEVYRINTYSVYQGREFQLCNENETEYLLWTSDSETALELDFENISLGDYEKWVAKSDVKHVFEVKEVIPDYFDR